jgi:putative PIN family toxin of toxin-antitoxin system
VSALVFGGKPKRAFQLGVSRLVDVAISEPIRTEVLRILRDKFRWPDERLTEARSLIATAVKTVVPTVTLHVIERDPDDDRVLECAVTAKAEFIVTGDSDLLDLGKYEDIEIIQVAEFLARIGEPGQP